MEAPATVKKYTFRKGAPVARHSRFGFDRFHRSHPLPCQANPTKSHTEAALRRRSGPAIGGAYLRVSGLQGRLRACTPKPKAPPPTATPNTLVTTLIIKAARPPGRWPGGRAAFQGGLAGRVTGDDACTIRGTDSAVLLRTAGG
jgi:hypothetical protein